MPDDMSVSVSVSQRIERIEKQNRRLRQLLLTIAGAFLAAVLLGAAATQLTELEGSKLTLRDTEGNVRFQIVIDPDAGLVQKSFDSDGKIRLQSGIQPNGLAYHSLWHATGKQAMTFTSNSDSKAEQIVVAPNGASVKLTALDEAVQMSFMNSEGKLRHATLMIDESGDLIQMTASSTGKTASMSRTYRGGETTTSWNSPKGPEVTIVADGTGAKLRVDDKNDKSRFMLSVDADDDDLFHILGGGSGEPVFTTAVRENGYGAFNVFTRGGKGLEIDNGLNDGARLRFYAPGDSEKSRLLLGANKEAAFQVFYDNSGEPRITSLFENRDNGVAFHELADSKGIARIKNVCFANDEASFILSDRVGKQRITLNTFADNVATARHIDSQGVLRHYTGTYANGQSGMALLDKNGSPKFSAALNSDDRFAFYREQSASEAAWKTTGNILQVIDIAARFGEIINSADK